MTRYTTRRPVRLFYVEDDTYSEPSSVGLPEVPDHVATFTGLIDADGREIWRSPDPIGFVFWSADQ
jgi:hypothetical protein